MSNKWSWVFGILTAAAFVFGLVFFAVTQQPTPRDWAVLGIGCVFGVTGAALVATFIFHKDERAKRLAADKSLAEAAAIAEQTRLDALASAEIALVEKRTALLAALPTRAERLDELNDQILQLQVSIASAEAIQSKGRRQAADATRMGFGDMAAENSVAADTWELARARYEQQLSDAQADRNRLAGMTDADFVAEQVHLRGLEIGPS